MNGTLGSPSGGNIQGPIHLGGPMGRKKRKRLRKAVESLEWLRWALVRKEWSEQARQAAQAARRAHSDHSSAAKGWHDWAMKHGAVEAAKHYQSAHEHFAVGNVESGHRAMRFGHHGLGRVMPAVIRGVMKL